MTPRPSLLLVLMLLITTHSRAQGRAPHGLAHEKLVAFSPSAYDFFHPNTQPSSPLPLAATVQSSLAHESRAENNKGGGKVGAGGIAAIIFGFVFALLLAMGVYYVATTRRANLSRNNTVIPAAA
ncbi:uncharacterized protein LOC112529816 [Cynara cardunculus var. scolymus]|uniref:Transmembrane protein n=1 Tax=Cynara cardunculus var. scolymus TaxID=59895 RepID=A0A118K5N4_CYNCS|nr:uncharacterized protein LOC112529816 [Cynara cardunculus var. scolymus]KVI09363.1 hypothetical protein Ccrd_012267 [Cynara cardunculus var. scolymus]